MSSEIHRNSLQKVLFDAEVEIAVLDGTDNSSFKSLLAELKKQSDSLSTSVGEIAKLYDISADDALEKVIDSGCRRFWWNRERYGIEGIRRLLSDLSQWDVAADIEVELTPDECQRLDEAGCRKVTGSEIRLCRFQAATQVCRERHPIADSNRAGT